MDGNSSKTSFGDEIGLITDLDYFRIKDAPPEPTAFDLAVGLLTIAQAGAKLAFLFPPQSDAIFLTERLICRGSVQSVELAGKIRVPVDALSAFIKGETAAATARNGMGLPKETPALLSGVEGSDFASPWRVQLSAFCDAVYAELDSQIPKSPAGLEVKERDAQGMPIEPAVNLKVTLTPSLMAILARPVPAGNWMFPAADASAFSGMAEIYLATRLQKYAMDEVNRLAFVNSQDVKLQGVGAMYRSAAAYKNVTDAALASFQTGRMFTLTRMLSRNDPTQYQSPPPVTVSLEFSDAAIMGLVKSSPARLACLAF